MYKLLFTFLALFLLTTLHAQSDDVYEDQIYSKPRLMIGLKGSVGIPYGEFWDKMEQVGFGFGGEVHYRVQKDLPIYAGISMTGFIFDLQSQNYYENINGFSILLREQTRTNIFMGHLQLRLKPDVNFFLEPYIDGLFGFKNLYNRTTVRDVEIDETDIINSSGDWASSFGGAVGVQIPIFRDGASRGYIDLRMVYLKGTSADYLVRREEPNQNYANPIDAFETKNSATDMLIPQIGFTVLIGKNWTND
ncbi:MAG: hypothetical protein AB8G15_11760 [Saprospiraceae bacterium]